MMLLDAGVPWDIAFSLDASERMGLIVICGEIKGGVFDWDAMSWKDKK